MNVASPSLDLPADVARHLYPVGAYHWVVGRIYRVNQHGPETNGRVVVRSLLVLRPDASHRTWVRDQIVAELTALRSALLDERPAAFPAHLAALEWPVLWVARRRIGSPVESAFSRLVVSIGRRDDAINALNRLSAAIHAELE